MLQGDAMRNRINCVSDSITDPFSTEIRCHYNHCEYRHHNGDLTKPVLAKVHWAVSEDVS